MRSDKLTPMGQKSEPETKARVLDLLAEGLSLRKIAALPGMPSPSLVIHWARTDEDFRARYGMAREAQIHGMVEEAIEIADDDAKDYVDGANGPIGNGVRVNRARLRVDTRKWFAARMLPSVYGEKAEVKSTVEGSITIITGVPQRRE